MPEDFRHLQSMVINYLSDKERTFISLSSLFKNDESYNKGRFYKKYKTKYHFLGMCINAFIRQELASHSQKTLQQKFYLLLRHIKREQTFYINIYNLIARNKKAKNCICHQLKNHLNKYVHEWTKGKMFADKKIVKTYTNLIYKQIYYWISHKCDGEVEEIFEEIKTTVLYLECLANPDYLRHYLLSTIKLNSLDRDALS